MSDLRIPLKIFKNRIKIRYPLLSITFIIISLIIPVFVPYNPNYSPINSFSNGNDKGHSQIMDKLQSSYNVNQEHLDITKYGNPSNSLITIISPQRYFTNSEIEFLEDWTRGGGYIIVGGTSKYTLDLFINLDLGIDVSGSKIMDFQSEYKNPNYLPVSFETDPQNMFTAIAPLALDHIPRESSKIKILTSSSAEKASCVEFSGTNCARTFSIGYIDNNNNIAVFLDNWLLRNFVIDGSPQNLLFIQNIIDDFGGNIDNIIIDESHYNWAPLNKKGVEVLINNLSQSQFYPPIIFLFSVIFPLLLVLMNGNFTKSRTGDGDPITSKLRERIDRLYLDKIIAVPLSMEEQILVEENLELNARNQYYFQYVANYYLEIIENKKLTDSIPADLVDSLKFMKHEIIDKQTGWELIKIINHYLDNKIEGNKIERS